MALPGALDPKLSLSFSKTSFHNFRRIIPSFLSLSRQFTGGGTPFKSKIMVVKCSSTPRNQEDGGGNGSSSGGSLKNALSNIVDKRVEELLGKEENKEMLDKLNKATERVQLARKELANIQRQELEAQQMRKYIDQLETRAAEIAECQKEVLEAKAMVEEAERALGEKGENTRNEERLESVKAASVCALVGTLAAVPIYLSRVTDSPQLLLQLGVTFASCALFGVTFRYAVRRDIDDTHLKTGAAGAFAVVKGLATLSGGSPLEFNSASFLSHAVDGAFFVFQDLFIFTFAAVSLDFCFKSRFVSPFPLREIRAEEQIK
ncbi:uncharacterized protein LOC110732291 [Chenopodium quinoa]|uniref:uncharacterized protein LOC110732291 n=1 Tax=Chenopodium quinoa TaxID=63459 RepID=UPI000B7900E5|nr:uncharacterized protein LOC110732291 [Chenopodium quinoa]